MMNRAISSLAFLAVSTPASLAWAEDETTNATAIGTESASQTPEAPATSEPAPAPPAAPIAAADPMEPAATSTAAGPAIVDQPGATNTSTEEHSGFYLGMQIPIGRLKVEDEDGILEASGVGGGFTLQMGGTPAPNLVIYGEASTVRVVNPDIQIGARTISTGDAETAMNLVQIGPGIVYYIMPTNIYVGGSVLFSRVSLESDGETIGETETGVGIALRAGREFWVGKDWGLGLGVEFRAASMPDKDSDVTMEASSFGVTLGATYH